MNVQDQRMHAFLTQVVRDPHRECRWLNTLSLMEHIGARKIQRAVGHRHDQPQVLEHAADEARHAWVLKRLCIQGAKDVAGQYLARDAAVHYFSALDHQSSAQLGAALEHGDTFLSYLVTTVLVERRAMRVYAAYRDHTPREDVREELQRIMEEETAHRRTTELAVRKRLAHRSDLAATLEGLEAELFSALLGALEQDMHGAPGVNEHALQAGS